MKILCSIACVLTLAGCSHKAPEPQAAAKATAPAVSTPWDDLKKDEQRARDVQKTVDQQAARERKQIDDASQ